MQQERRGEQERRETEDHHPGDLVVQVLVGVERDASDEGEIHTDHGEEERRGRRRPAAPRASAEPAEIPSDADGVDDDQ